MNEFVGLKTAFVGISAVERERILASSLGPVYQHCFNNSLWYIDPDGRTAIALPAIVGIALVAGVGVILLDPDLSKGIRAAATDVATKAFDLAQDAWKNCKKLCVSVGWHGKNHSPMCHVQVMFWISGVSGSDVTGYANLPDSACPPDGGDHNSPPVCFLLGPLSSFP